MWSEETIRLIHAACTEDLAEAGDVTSSLLGDPDTETTAGVVPRAGGVICGMALGPEICKVFSDRLDSKLDFTPAMRTGGRSQDGQEVNAGETVATVAGPKAAVLAVERTLLNFLGRMGGVATLTHQYVETARQANPNVQILDTRKTIPGWRELDKYAVGCGGGYNHRMGLYDAILIKDNHLAGVPTERLAGTLSDMLNRLQHGKVGSTRRGASDRALNASEGSSPKFVEVEVDDLDQLAEVCKVVGVDLVLLDNFPLEQMRAAVEFRDAQGLRGKVALEASGRVTLENVADIAATGVDRISVGALTHSAPSLDIGLDF